MTRSLATNLIGCSTNRFDFSVLVGRVALEVVSTIFGFPLKQLALAWSFGPMLVSI